MEEYSYSFLGHKVKVKLLICISVLSTQLFAWYNFQIFTVVATRGWIIIIDFQVHVIKVKVNLALGESG